MLEDMKLNAPVKKRPTFLIVLLILTGLSLISILIGGVIPIFSGPMTQQEMQSAELESLKAMNLVLDKIDDEQTKEEMTAGFNQKIEVLRYIQTKAFWLHHLFQVLIFALGAAGVYFMIKLNKLGFHLYIIYCLMSVGSIYFVLPFDMIVQAEVMMSLFLSGLFVFMYSRNLKYFSDHNADDDFQSNYSN